jgi:hypothetical protein
VNKCATALLLAVCGCTGRQPHPASVTQEVVFTEYSPLSRNAEIGRRVLTPVTYARGRTALRSSGKEFREQQIDLSAERFALYVPSGAPPKNGWGLLVFISPAPEPVRPSLWRPQLDRHELILVSPANAGNDASVLDRRLPLALLAYENVRAQQPIDPDRVYVGGFSGGSRAAEIAALGYPDVFRGALLEAGSDPIDGERGIYKPSWELFRQFQQSRLVYVTGERDQGNLLDDQVSIASMKANCVFDVEVVLAHRLGHEFLDQANFGRALDSLERRSPPDPAELEKCNARMQLEIGARLAEAEAAVARGDRNGAYGLLKAIDGRYAGLAAPGSVELDARLSGRKE